MDQLCGQMEQLSLTQAPRKKRPTNRRRAKYRHWNHERWIACGSPTTQLKTPNGLVGYIQWTYDKTPKHKGCWLPKAHRHCCCNVDKSTDTPVDTHQPSPVSKVNKHGRVCKFEVDQDGGLVTEESGVVTTHMPLAQPHFPYPTPF